MEKLDVCRVSWVVLIYSSSYILSIETDGALKRHPFQVADLHSGARTLFKSFVCFPPGRSLENRLYEERKAGCQDCHTQRQLAFLVRTGKYCTARYNLKRNMSDRIVKAQTRPTLWRVGLFPLKPLKPGFNLHLLQRSFRPSQEPLRVIYILQTLARRLPTPLRHRVGNGVLIGVGMQIMDSRCDNRHLVGQH